MYIAPGSPAGLANSSGSITSGSLGPNTVYSGNIASGQVGWPHLASGAVRSGSIGDGAVVSGSIASGSVGQFALASGAIGPLDIASGAVQSGDIASGAAMGQAGGGAFNIASGTLSTYDHASGCVVRAAQFVSPFQSGTPWPIITEEAISGVRAVCISQSGNIRVAMAAVSGRMPAIGIVIDNVASGISGVNVYTQGAFQVSSGMADFSGYLGKPVWVGRSGQVVTFSGSWNSGGFNGASGGDFVQRFGVCYNSGAFIVNPDSTLLQNQLLGINDLVDVINRGFGV